MVWTSRPAMSAKTEPIFPTRRVSSGGFRLGGRRCGVPVRVAEQVAMRLGSVAAGDRDVELGIAPHAVLGHVQTGGLDMLLDADPPQALHRPEAPERSAEGECADRAEPERLHAELVERACVDEPAAP